VLAVFSKIFYLLNEEGEVFWITTEDSPMHRRSLQIPSKLPEVKSGSEYLVENDIILIEPTLRLDMSSGMIWESPRIEPINRTLEQSDWNHIRKIIQQLLDTSTPKGMGIFLPNLLASKPLDESEGLFDKKYQEILNKIISTDINYEYEKFCTEADKLVGLGEGLTPSGDDFYGSLFFCMNYLSDIYDSNLGLDQYIEIEKYRKLTNLISYAIMSDMVLGHGIEPLHKLLQNILHDGEMETIRHYYNQLLNIGNSTGWDIFAGIVIGLLVFEHTFLLNPQINEYVEICA
jgi:hypothetical protein